MADHPKTHGDILKDRKRHAAKARHANEKVKTWEKVRAFQQRLVKRRTDQLHDLVGRVPGARPGWPIVPGTVGGIHETGGLPGYPAHDYFAPAGAPAVAPVDGVIRRFSGHDPSLGAVQGAGGPLGWSIYLAGGDGNDYYLTHMGTRTVIEGQHVEQGEKIGTVADYHSFGRADHIHMGVHSGRVS